MEDVLRSVLLLGVGAVSTIGQAMDMIESDGLDEEYFRLYAEYCLGSHVASEMDTEELLNWYDAR